MCFGKFWKSYGNSSSPSCTNPGSVFLGLCDDIKKSLDRLFLSDHMKKSLDHLFLSDDIKKSLDRLFLSDNIKRSLDCLFLSDNIKKSLDHLFLSDNIKRSLILWGDIKRSLKRLFSILCYSLLYLSTGLRLVLLRVVAEVCALETGTVCMRHHSNTTLK